MDSFRVNDVTFEATSEGWFSTGPLNDGVILAISKLGIWEIWSSETANLLSQGKERTFWIALVYLLSWYNDYKEQKG